MFKQATKASARARLAIVGPTGSGKTYSALAIAQGLGERVAVIDTERGSASKYADKFDFCVAELQRFGPLDYVRAIEAAGAAGFDVLIIDSLSHAWVGVGGCLEQVDSIAARNRGQKFQAWGQVTPKHNALLDAIMGAPCHVIATMRTKTEWVLEPNARGKMAPRKVGTAPVQRDGVEYEFDIVGELDGEHMLRITKSRMSRLDDATIGMPGAELGQQIAAWLSVDERPDDGEARDSTGGLRLTPEGEARELIRALDEQRASLTEGQLVEREKAVAVVKTARVAGAVEPLESYIAHVEEHLGGMTWQAASSEVAAQLYATGEFADKVETKAHLGALIRHEMEADKAGKVEVRHVVRAFAKREHRVATKKAAAS